MSQTTFVPKQLIPFDGALLKELQGDVSDTIAADLLAHDLHPLSSTSILHDNGCGYGAVTLAAMASNPPAGIQIRATDINPLFMEPLQKKRDTNPTWPLTIEVADAMSLTFPDETFTHSLTMFVFAGLSDDVAAASHIFRTLKPGGQGLVAVWKEMPWITALENAHYRTRGENEPIPPFLSNTWYKKARLQEVSKKAGWEHIRYIERVAWLNMGTDLHRWATLAWSVLASPVGGWLQRDEDNWDEAISSIVAELQEGSCYKLEEGTHRIRMVADVAIVTK